LYKLFSFRQGYTKGTYPFVTCKRVNPLNPQRKKAMKKRKKEIKVRLTEEEYKQLLQRKTKPRLAEWIRETCLGQKPKKEIATVDPLLLYELNKIGVNLNQIAKKVQRGERNIEWLVTIIHIEKHLASLLENDC